MPHDHWFVEIVRLGGFQPAIIHGERPTGKGVSAPPLKFRLPPRRISKGMIRLELRELLEIYSPDGRFYCEPKPEELEPSETGPSQ